MRAVPRSVLLVLVLLALLVAGAFVAIRETTPDQTLRSPRSGDTSSGYRPGTVSADVDGATETAVRALPLALGYDYRSLGKGLSRASALMTDSFAQEFRRTFDGSAARLARSKKAVTRATVRAAGVVRAGDKEVTCLVYVDQVLVSSSTLKDEQAPVRVSQNRVLVGLVRSGDGWKVDSIRPF
jgi:Mce-associated membrane protein